jgi:hypothetical protein
MHAVQEREHIRGNLRGHIIEGFAVAQTPPYVFAIDQLTNSSADSAGRLLNECRRFGSPTFRVNVGAQDAGIDGYSVASLAGLNVNHINEGTDVAIPYRLLSRKSERFQKLVYPSDDRFGAHGS